MYNAEYLKTEANLKELSRIISSKMAHGMPKLLGVLLLRNMNKVSSIIPSYENMTSNVAMAVFDQWLIEKGTGATYEVLDEALSSVQLNQIRSRLPICKRFNNFILN